MHRVEQILALSIDVNPEFFTFAAQTILQIRDRRLGARRIGNNHHRELSLHDRLINIDDTALCFGENLRDPGNYSRVINPKDGNDEPVS